IIAMSSLPDSYSYSTAVGDGSGTEYSTAYDGCITSIRVWEHSKAYIHGIQLCYDGNWTTLVCTSNGNPEEMTLRNNESIIQVSGKYYSGRSLKVGHPYGNSFHFYPINDGSELRFLSDQQKGNGITSIGRFRSSRAAKGGRALWRGRFGWAATLRDSGNA
uniref:Jacalin-type lectin domain-containing protein n=1 Tax=Cyprinus carpio TaxID=7962 RepID=A0A8C2ANW2_CYPCA